MEQPDVLLMPGLGLTHDGRIAVDRQELAAAFASGGDIGADYDVDVEDDDGNGVDLGDVVGPQIGFDPLLMGLVRAAQNRTRERNGKPPLPGFGRRPGTTPNRAPGGRQLLAPRPGVRPAAKPALRPGSLTPTRSFIESEDTMLNVRDIFGEQYEASAAGTVTFDVKPENNFKFSDFVLHCTDAGAIIEEIRYAGRSQLMGKVRWAEMASTNHRRYTLRGEAGPERPIKVRVKFAAAGTLSVTLYGKSEAPGCDT